MTKKPKATPCRDLGSDDHQDGPPWDEPSQTGVIRVIDAAHKQWPVAHSASDRPHPRATRTRPPKGSVGRTFQVAAPGGRLHSPGPAGVSSGTQTHPFSPALRTSGLAPRRLLRGRECLDSGLHGSLWSAGLRGAFAGARQATRSNVPRSARFRPAGPPVGQRLDRSPGSTENRVFTKPGPITDDTPERFGLPPTTHLSDSVISPTTRLSDSQPYVDDTPERFSSLPTTHLSDWPRHT